MGGEIVISDSWKQGLNLLIGLQTIIYFSEGWRIPISRI